MSGDILDYADFFTADEQLAYDEKAFEKRITKPPKPASCSTGFRAVLAEVTLFDRTTLDQTLHAFVERQGVQIGQIIHALRVAVTGKSIGLGVFETLEIWAARVRWPESIGLFHAAEIAPDFFRNFCGA